MRVAVGMFHVVVVMRHFISAMEPRTHAHVVATAKGARGNEREKVRLQGRSANITGPWQLPRHFSFALVFFHGFRIIAEGGGGTRRREAILDFGNTKSESASTGLFSRARACTQMRDG